MVRKIKGRVKAEKPEATIKEETSLPVVFRPRVNGSDFERVVYHLEKLIATLEAEPKYAPGVIGLKREALQHESCRGIFLPIIDKPGIDGLPSIFILMLIVFSFQHGPCFFMGYHFHPVQNGIGNFRSPISKPFTFSLGYNK